MAQNNMAPGANWAQPQPGQTPSPAMFPFMPQPHRYPSFGMQPQHINGDNMQHMFRMAERGMMAPPPVPQQKQWMQNGALPPNHPLMMENRPSFSPQHNNVMHVSSPNDMMSAGIRPQMNSPVIEKGVAVAKPPYNSFNDPQSSPSGSAGTPGLTPGTSLGLHNNSSGSIMADPLQLGVTGPQDADTKAIEARLHEILHPSQSSARNSEQKPLLSNGLMYNSASKALPPTAAERGSQPPSRPPSIPNDLKNVMPSMFTSDKTNPHTGQTVGTPMQLPPQRQQLQTPHLSTPIINNISAMEKAPPQQQHQPLPPMSMPLGQLPVGQSTMFNMGQDQSGMYEDGSLSDKDKPKRRRRKRCGTCTPCQQKQDCGECYVCRNKGQVNAICKLRKCMLLRKKALGECSENSGMESGFQESIGEQMPMSEMPMSEMPMSEMPTRMMLPHQQYQNYHTTQGNGIAKLQPPNDAMFYQSHINNKIPGAPSNLSGGQFDPSKLGRMEEQPPLAPSFMQQPHLKHSMQNSATPSPPRRQMASFRSYKTGQMPWARKAPVSFAKPSTPHKAVSNTSIPQDKLHDLYNTFKDDMQKMNERTFARANGVKVCKLMSKLLSLSITDDELKSSQPPKPSVNAWLECLPDSKMSNGKYLHESLMSPGDPIEACKEMETQPPISEPTKEPVAKPSEQDTTERSQNQPESENAHSQSTMSDIEDVAQTMDSNAVDSGFSSSSPADRQSPSPQTRFDIPPVSHIEENTNLDPPVSSETVKIRPIIHDTQNPGFPEAVSLPNQVDPAQNFSGLTQPHNLETPNIQTSTNSLFSQTSKMAEASAVPETKLQNQHLQRDINQLLPPTVNGGPMGSFPGQAYPMHGPPTSAHMPESGPTQEMNTLLSNLTAQMTGQTEVKTEGAPEPSDPAYLIKHNKVAVPQNCGCTNREYDENIEGPYYIHLGSANSIKSIRDLMEERTGHSGNAIRIEKVRYTTKEGRTSLGCPAAKWIVRRSGEEEKVLVLIKHRSGHYCANAWIIIAIVAWEGVPSMAANHMYDYLTRTMPVYGYETERRCGTNQPRDCACQGWDMNRKGASFSFGCSWSVYYNGCKFARSHIPRKFKLREDSFEGVMESKFQALGQHLAPLYKQLAPMSYGAQVRYESKAGDCRIGFRTGRPFSGVTATVDFCAHQHRDTHNMNNGCTVVVTLTKHRGLSKPDDEQLHTLPMYCLEDTDEHGQKRVEGAPGLEILNAFSQEQRRRSRPYKKRKKGTETYQSPKVKAAYVNSIKEQLSHTSSPLTKPSDQTQQPNAPIPMQRETAKQDLFNTPQKDPNSMQQQFLPGQRPGMPTNPMFGQPSTTHAQHSGMPPLPGAMHGLPGVPPCQPGAQHGQPTPMQYMPVQANAMNGQNFPSFAAAGSNDGMFAHSNQPPGYPQHSSFPHQPPTVINQQMSAQQPTAIPVNNAGTDLPSSISNMDTTSASADEAIPNKDSECELTADETEAATEGLKPPKPRPPSPEYDDPEGRDVHEENVHLFRDSTVGGVAMALSHGAVLFEVAKRELHATTALRKPDRYNPTRISLVFYQHKRLNFKKHGYQEYQRAEEERQKARKAAQDAGVEYIPKGLKYKQKRMQEAALRKARLSGVPLASTQKLFGIKKEFTPLRKKPGRKPGWKQKKMLKFAAYQYLWPQAVNHPHSSISHTVTTRWMKPECFVTGPYQKWVSLTDTQLPTEPTEPTDVDLISEMPADSESRHHMEAGPDARPKQPASSHLSQSGNELLNKLMSEIPHMPVPERPPSAMLERPRSGGVSNHSSPSPMAVARGTPPQASQPSPIARRTPPQAKPAQGMMNSSQQNHHQLMSSNQVDIKPQLQNPNSYPQQMPRQLQRNNSMPNNMHQQQNQIQQALQHQQNQQQRQHSNKLPNQQQPPVQQLQQRLPGQQTQNVGPSQNHEMFMAQHQMRQSPSQVQQHFIQMRQSQHQPNQHPKTSQQPGMPQSPHHPGMPQSPHHPGMPQSPHQPNMPLQNPHQQSMHQQGMPQQNLYRGGLPRQNSHQPGMGQQILHQQVPPHSPQVQLEGSGQYPPLHRTNSDTGKADFPTKIPRRSPSQSAQPAQSPAMHQQQQVPTHQLKPSILEQTLQEANQQTTPSERQKMNAMMQMQLQMMQGQMGMMNNMPHQQNQHPRLTNLMNEPTKFPIKPEPLMAGALQQMFSQSPSMMDNANNSPHQLQQSQPALNQQNAFNQQPTAPAISQGHETLHALNSFYNNKTNE